MACKDLRKQHSSLNEPAFLHGSSAAVGSLFPGPAKLHFQQQLGQQPPLWGSSALQHPPSAPVYGPSKAPRLPQFVDLITNYCGMTPFLPLSHNMDCVNSEVVRQSDALQKVPTFTPPRQSNEHIHMAIGTRTPSSAMGMTVSPSTTCCVGGQFTPAAIAPSTTSRLEICTQSLPQKISLTSVVEAPSSLTHEFESAFGEQTVEKGEKKTSKGEDEDKDENQLEYEEGMTAATEIIGLDAPCDNSGTMPDNRCESSDPGLENNGTKRRSKGKRRSKLKNGSQQHSQRPGTTIKNIRSSPFLSPDTREKFHVPMSDKMYTLALQCHGGRTVMALSSLEQHAGAHVIFEGDRGLDLGEVINCEEVTGESSGTKDNNHRTQRFVRFATEQEVGEWRGSLVTKEDEAMVECRVACEELGLTIRVTGAAFQFDCQKLTFMYESAERVDFRSLLQVMFSKYRCRIWMERVNLTP